MFSTMMPVGVVKAQQKLFKVTIIAPGNANMIRRQWGQIFANSLQQLGIDARVVYLGWTTGVYPRALIPDPATVGKTFDQGGFDILLLGWTPGLNPEPRQLFYGGDPAFFAPDGQNYYLWNNATSNQLLDTFITSTDPAEQDAALQTWQTVYYNDLPASQIMYQSNVALVNPDLTGYDWVYFNVQPSPELLMGKTSVTYASTSEIESLIPPLSNSWYDTIVFTPMFNGLAQVNYSKQIIPALLTSWTPSNNGFTWTFNLRQGVKWHDGFTFSADDVLFSLWALMNGNTASQFVGYYQSVYGNNVKFTWQNGSSTTLGSGTRAGNITAVNAYTVQADLPVLALSKPYGYFDPYLLTFSNNIIPKHIFEKVPVADWKGSVFNTGEGGPVTVPGIGNVSYTGPVGTGPYKWASFDSAAQLFHLQKFNDYWNRTALESIGRLGVTDYYIKFIADKTPAIASLKNGQVDMLDTNYEMQTEVNTPGAIDPSWGTVFLNTGSGRQEIGYNMRHPIFGTGTATPLGTSTPSRAAEAARYVRTAFDYAIPRELIISNLLSGYGQPGATPMLPTQPYYNSSITARPYDLAAAADYLKKAGYTIPGPTPLPTLPSFILGMSFVISGYFKDADGNLLANRDLQLMETLNNATYLTNSTLIGETTTDLNGWYSFTVTPMTTGTHYYFLFDRQASAGSEWTYVRSQSVSSLSDVFTTALTPLNNATDNLNNQVGGLQGSVQTLTIVAAAALVVAIAFGVLNFYMIWKKR
jgi:ABC-type transport system substrate-binding protein